MITCLSVLGKSQALKFFFISSLIALVSKNNDKKSNIKWLKEGRSLPFVVDALYGTLDPTNIKSVAKVLAEKIAINHVCE